MLSAERAHHFSARALRFFSKIPLIKEGFRTNLKKYQGLEREVFGLKFPTPLGLAAGFDKNAEMVDPLAGMGFGFIEIGTVTPKPQPGNPKPRLFRLKADKAIINRMGFNNHGVDAAALRLAKRKSNVIVGGNIGKNKVTPNEEAVSDYRKAFNVLYEVVDYFVVNVSSPNTPGLRELQEKGPLLEILNAVQQENNKRENPKPVLLKIAPDLTDTQLDEICEIVLESKINGVIATNTTISRDGLTSEQSKVEKIGAGGLSGQPLTERSTEVISYINKKLGGNVPIIGVGGIMNPQDAKAKLDAGASLIQIYSGFVYRGRGLIKGIYKELSKSSAH